MHMKHVSMVLPLQLLYKLAERAKLKDKVEAMFNGEHINVTEDRAVLHVALRAPRDAVLPPRCTACVHYHKKNSATASTSRSHEFAAVIGITCKVS